MKRTFCFAWFLAAYCSLIGCAQKSNPAGISDSAIIGTWTGSVVSSGGFSMDTNSIDLRFTKTGYTMLRGMVTHASSGDAILDSAWETGTYTVNGSNLTLSGDTCKMRASWESAMSVTQCDAPKTVVVAISNNAWNITMNEWKNGLPVTYPMHKQ